MDDLLRDPLGIKRARSAQALRPLALAAAAAALAAGCGTDDTETETGSQLPEAGGGGSLVYAVPALPGSLDPLLATSRAALTVTRQVHEPLLAELRGPYGDDRRQPGLVISARPSEGGSVWTLTLRRRVRFQDGTPFNAEAVLANAGRWTSLAAGRRLLPDLFAVDAPRPDQVRFLLERPARDLPSRLASPRLGIVSPQALVRRRGELRFWPNATRSGTGPFAVARAAPQRLELARYAGWWGSPAGLGPALDGVAFVGAPTSAGRLDLLRSGSAQVADPLDGAALRALAADPLLASVGGPGSGIGLEGSVRGIDSARVVPLLSRVWLTDIAG